MAPRPPTSWTPTNGTPHSPKANVDNSSNSENPSSNSCDYTQVANISPLPILKWRVSIMDKLKVKVKNLYPQAHACMLAIALLACVIHQHNKNSSATMAGLKRGEPHPSVKWSQSPIHQPFIDHDSWSTIKSPEARNWCAAKNSFLHSEYPDPCLAPNPWKRHNLVNLQMSFLWLEFPEMYITWWS